MASTLFLFQHRLNMAAMIPLPKAWLWSHSSPAQKAIPFPQYLENPDLEVLAQPSMSPAIAE